MDFKLTEEKRYIILYTWLKVNIFLDPFTLSSVKVRGHLSKVRLDDRYFNVVIRSLIQFVELLSDSLRCLWAIAQEGPALWKRRHLFRWCERLLQPLVFCKGFLVFLIEPFFFPPRIFSDWITPSYKILSVSFHCLFLSRNDIHFFSSWPLLDFKGGSGFYLKSHSKVWNAHKELL